MESLIQRQSDIIELIKQIERNFSKDSARRKTRTYLDERLDTLDKLWAEFQSSPPAPSASTSTEAPPSKVADLLSQQRTNFRAFNRMVKNIKVDEIRDKWELEDELKNVMEYDRHLTLADR
ncbi:hypothetical protein JYU34_014464 [Plutella xylostella]|uniref:Uncharacterized protein n=1 Tax=Plutella xylostella TaxID=51655 RepID=A0ABQ7Q8C7_PLUXY|nr:hypothetical protein JYU34_014464 [Plutella xylostella]